MITENLEKEYYTKDETIIALKDFTYSFEKGRFYAIMGHSGSGKSTLIRILGLIDTYSSGRYVLKNKDISKLNDFELSELRMNEIGFIFQEFYLEESLKAYENVVLPMLINSKIEKKERKERAIKLLKLMGLDKRVKHYPKELSGGEKQRVCLARALANNPDYILADEPTGNLDEKNEQKIFELLKKLSQEGKCVIVVTHSKNVCKYADCVLYLNNGQLVDKNENI